MNLYRIYRTDEIGYNEYDSAVVAAETEEEAKVMAPVCDGLYLHWDGTGWLYGDGTVYDEYYSPWTTVDEVSVELLGTANKGTKRSVILASFNAG